MDSQPTSLSGQLLRPADDDELSLLELADRLLNRGVVITGEATISVAGIDLIYLGLNVVLSAAENLLKKQGSESAPPRNQPE